MTDSQLVSVLMPCYRESAKDFTEALASILKQTYHRIEVVVVFDNPDDNTLYDIAQNYSSHDSRICLVRNERNLGLAASLERAFKSHAVSISAEWTQMTFLRRSALNGSCRILKNMSLT